MGKFRSDSEAANNLTWEVMLAADLKTITKIRSTVEETDLYEMMELYAEELKLRDWHKDLGVLSWFLDTAEQKKKYYDYGLW